MADLSKVTIMGRRILVRPIKEPETKIIMVKKSDTDGYVENKGEVVKIGLGTQLQNGEFIPLNVQVGDVVLFGRYAKNFVDIEGEKFILLLEEEIYAILNRAMDVKYVQNN